MESTTTEATGNISERNCQEYGGLARSVILLSLDGGALGSICQTCNLPIHMNPCLKSYFTPRGTNKSIVL